MIGWRLRHNTPVTPQCTVTGLSKIRLPYSTRPGSVHTILMVWPQVSRSRFWKKLLPLTADSPDKWCAGSRIPSRGLVMMSDIGTDYVEDEMAFRQEPWPRFRS